MPFIFNRKYLKSPLHLSMQLRVGIDIGGTTTSVGLVDENGRIIFKNTFLTGTESSPNALILAIKTWIQVKAKSLQAEIVSAGIGAPNGNIHTGNIEYAPNLPWKGIIPLRSLFEKALQVPVKLTNDANAAAMGEWIFGAAKNCNNFLFITLGTGLGSAIVSEGKMIYGHSGMAAELGHIIIKENGRPCGCGRNGCAETYCSASGLVRTYAEITSIDSKEISARLIYEKALQGEAKALQAFELLTDDLALLLANAVAFSSPEKIFLFGGLTQAGVLLMKPLKMKFEARLMEIFKGKVDLEFSGLHENHAAILGASALLFTGRNF